MTIAVDFSDPTIQADPYPVYRQLRQQTPVAWNGRAWLISRYADVAALFTDPRSSSARVEATFQGLPDNAYHEFAPLRQVLGSRMLLADPPEHTRLRVLVTKAFSARTIEERRPRIEAICERFLDRVLPRGRMDIMHDLATLVPGWVIADYLGVPPDDQPVFTRWSRDQVRIYDRPGMVNEHLAVLHQGQASMLEMRAYLEEVIAARRRQPANDLITQLVHAEESSDRLSTEELIVMCVALLVGGNNSTAHLIGNAILTLLRHPNALARLRADPALIRSALEEVLRYESPVQATSRVAREAIAIDGVTIAAGENISLLIGAANRDEAQFPEPDRFDIARQPNRHLTFAHGAHFCLGTPVARAAAQAAVLGVVRRCADLQLASDQITWLEGFSFRGPKSLPV